MNEIAEIKVFQFVGDEVLQGTVLSCFQMLVIQITFQAEIHKVDVHLNGDLIVGDSGVGHADL